MIVGFRSEETRLVFRGLMSRHLPADIQNTARRKLRMLDAAVTLSDLRSPPGNRLEPLKGSRAGQHSIRINDQWRICFVWREAKPNGDVHGDSHANDAPIGGSADNVEIADYH